MSISAIGFLAVFVGLMLLAIFRHPVYGLYAYVVTFFGHPPTRWWSAELPDIRWAYWAALITLVLTIVHLLFRQSANHKDWYRQGCIWLIVCYTLWMWIQSPWALNTFYHERSLGLFQNYVVVMFLVYVLIDTRERLRAFLFLITMGCFYLGYVAYTTGGGGRLDGVGGPGMNDASSLGMVLGVGAILGGTLFFSQTGYIKWISAAAMPFLLNGLIMSSSRGAFLALVCGGLCLAYVRPRAQTGKLLVYALLGFSAFVYLANDVFWERMGTIEAAVSETDEADQAIETRLVLFGKQWQMFKARPFGGGAKTTHVLSVQYLGQEHITRGMTGRSSHNTIMSALVDQGVPGIVLWLGLAFAVVRKGLLSRKLSRLRDDTEGEWLSIGLISALMVYFVAAQFAPFLQQEIYIWLVAATWAAYSVLRDTPDDNPVLEKETRHLRSAGLSSD